MGHGHQICKAELEKYVNQFQTVLKDSNDPVIARLRDFGNVLQLHGSNYCSH